MQITGRMQVPISAAALIAERRSLNRIHKASNVANFQPKRELAADKNELT
jgi:hypothetical protein